MKRRVTSSLALVFPLGLGLGTTAPAFGQEGAAQPAAGSPASQEANTKTVNTKTGSTKGARGKKQVLFFTKSAGFEHSVIKQKDGQPSHAEKILKELGEKNGFEVTHSKDGTQLSPENLARYDAFVLFTTGDLTQAGTDKHPPIPSKDAFLEAVRKGKGLVGIHAASDTFHTDSDRFVDDGANADPFIKALGGEFIRHGAQQSAAVYCADKKFPGMAECTDGMKIHDEWYSLKNMPSDLHVTLWIATWTLKNTGGDSVYRRAPYPVTWARKEGKGRVFYTALGHREDVWESSFFQNMLVGGIKWAAGAAQANVKPNVAQVTPFYKELPPQDDSKKQAASPAAPKAPAAPTAAQAPGAPAAPTPPAAR